MLFKDFKRLNFKDQDLNRIQDNVDAAINPLLKLPLLDGIFLVDVTIKVTDTAIPHRLNRPFKGWVMTAKNAAGDIYEGTNTKPELFLVLKASSQVIVDLWIF